MQLEISKHQKDILETDRSASLEIGFLLQHVHGVADAWVQQEVFDILQKTSPPMRAVNKDELSTCTVEGGPAIRLLAGLDEPGHRRHHNDVAVHAGGTGTPVPHA